jgi:hypothetical protein
VAVAIILAGVVALQFVLCRGAVAWVPWLTLALLFAVGVPAWALSPTAVELDGGVLRVRRRRWRAFDIPVADVTRVEPGPDVRLSTALRLFGVGGFFGTYGLLWVRGIGKLRGYVTRGVPGVLIHRASALPVLVTPDDPALVAALRRGSASPRGRRAVTAYTSSPPFDAWQQALGGSYDELILPRLVTALAAHAPAARRVADLGIGTGDLVVALARRGFAVVGVDVSGRSGYRGRRSPPRPGNPPVLWQDIRALARATGRCRALRLHRRQSTPRTTISTACSARWRLAGAGGLFVFEVNLPAAYASYWSSVAPSTRDADPRSHRVLAGTAHRGRGDDRDGRQVGAARPYLQQPTAL